MSRPKLSRLMFACLLTALLAGLSGCEQRNQFVPPPPPTVTVARPVQQAVADSIEFTGTTRATARVDLRARVNGYLKEIKFEDGQMVQSGDLLFIIEREPFEAALQAAEANYQKAVASHKLAEANLSRILELRRKNVATQQEVDVQQAEREAAAAEVQSQQAAVRQAQLNLGYTEIRAPITGRISRHLVDVGNLVQAESTLLATIESIDPIHAYFYLSESELLRFMRMLRENKLPDPEEHPPELELGLANETGFPHKGYLDYREPGVDPETGTIERRGVFPNPDHILIPGLFVRIRAQVGEPQPRLLVEERAIGSDQRGNFVLVVNGDDTVEYRPVELGIAVDGLRVVERGIEPTDQVVVNGLQRARPGAKVHPEFAGQSSETAVAKNETGESSAAAAPATAATSSGPNTASHNTDQKAE